MKYLDEQGNEIAMQTELSRQLEQITDDLKQMTVKERLVWFEQKMFPEPIHFIREIDGTKYIVRSFFDECASESIEEKMRRLTQMQTNCKSSL